MHPPEASTALISYLPYRTAWHLDLGRIRRLIEETGARRVCEVGGGANPAVGLDYIEREGLSYVLLDISESELAKAADGYTKVVADICADPLDLQGRFDLVISRMVAEHLPDPVRFHRNVRSLLVANGRAFHYFPTLYAFPFVLNRLLPPSLSARLLGAVQHDRDESGVQPDRDESGCHAKFRVYYRWCRGPSNRQIARLESIGYVVEEYLGMMGHLYFLRVPPLQAVIDSMTRVALKWPFPAVTAYAWVILKRTAAGHEATA